MFCKSVSLGSQNRWHVARCFLSVIGLFTKPAHFPSGFLWITMNVTQAPSQFWVASWPEIAAFCCLTSPPIHSTSRSLWSKPMLMQIVVCSNYPCTELERQKMFENITIALPSGFVSNLACRKAEKKFPPPPPFPCSHSSLHCQPSTVSCPQLFWFLYLHPELWEQQEQQKSHG